MPAVQFYGIDQVITAVGNLKCPAWGIFVGRMLFMKYEGGDITESIGILQRSLESLELNSSEAVYTLKCFENDNKPIKIKENTVCDGGSFNFKLIDPEERDQRKSTFDYRSKNIMDRLDKIEKVVSGTGEDGDEFDDEPKTLEETIIGLLDRPKDLADLISIGRSIITGTPLPSTIGNVTGSSQPGAGGGSREQQMQRLGDAIDILEKKDPNIVVHLEKLARMATEKPQQFNLLIMTLDGMQ